MNIWKEEKLVRASEPKYNEFVWTQEGRIKKDSPKEYAEWKCVTQSGDAERKGHGRINSRILSKSPFSCFGSGRAHTKK